MSKHLTYLFFAVATAVLFFTSCSSAPVQEVAPAAPVEPVKADASKKSTKPQVIEIKPDASAAAAPAGAASEISRKQYDSLRSAVSSQNLELIRQASLDILQNNAKDTRALNALAMTYYNKGFYETAQYLLNKVIENDPKSASAYSNLGLVYLALNEKREAIDSFRKALDYDSDHQAATENLSAIYVQNKEYQKASALLAGIKSRTEGAQINYAIALSGTGQHQEATTVYERVLAQNAGQKQVLLNLAILKIDKLSQFEDGLDLLNRLKFVDAEFASPNLIKALENKAKAGLK